MKKNLSILLSATLLTATSHAQTPTREVGRANLLQGKYVFFHATPVAAYTVAFTFIDNPTFTGCANAQDVAGAALKLARDEAAAQNKAFDAIIIQPGERDTAIRFATESAPENALERAEQVGGKYTFILATPAAVYNVKARMPVVANGWNNTCYATNEILAALLRKATKKGAFDALIYNGISAESIKFN